MAERLTKNGPRVKSSVKELTLLYEISQALQSAMDLRMVLKPVLKMMATHMGMMRGTITILNRESGEIYIEEAYGLSRSQMEKGRYRLGEGVTGKVIQTGEPAVVPKISQEPLFLNRTGARRKLRKKDVSFICVPIKMGREVIGALSVDRLFSDEVSLKEEVRLLTIIASMIAQAVKLRLTALEERRKLEEENIRLQEELKVKFNPSNIIGNSKAIREVYNLIEQVAPTGTTVLLRGESGTGKELVAHAIHYASPRASRPFIKVNCAALPESIIESELFGHEKGAFTGALTERKGRFELADGGTIFLDEISELSPSVQAKLLRVIQEREFERVGGTKTVKVDVRIIASTNRDLEKLVAEGRFREDLYYRINVFPIHLPPLRERKTDIPLLIDYFVEKYSKIHGKQIKRVSTPAIDMMMSYHWPGNIRELENVIERAVILSTDGVIHSHHLPPTLQTADATGTFPRGTLQEMLDNVEREMIVEALKQSRGNIREAARLLGITERVMGLRVKKHGINPKRFKK